MDHFDNFGQILPGMTKICPNMPKIQVKFVLAILSIFWLFQIFQIAQDD